MSVKTWPKGIAPQSSNAHRTVYGLPVMTRRRVWWVNSSHARADDAGAGYGSDPEEPLATVNTTYAALSANDIIIVGAGHAETLALTCNKIGVGIFCLGSGSGRPIFTAGGAYVFNLTAAGQHIDNAVLYEGSSESSAALIAVAASASRLTRNELNQNRQTPASASLAGATTSALIISAGSRHRILDNTFQTAHTAEAAAVVLPTHAIEFAAVGANTWIHRNTFDGNALGWDGAAIYGGAFDVIGLRMDDNTFTDGADIEFSQTLRGFGSGNGWTTPGQMRFTNDRIRWLESGLIASSAGGHAVLRGTNFWYTGTAYYVDSAGTNASDSNPGTRRTYPFATLGAAISAFTASNGDLILVEATHRETFTTAFSATKASLAIFGLGTGTNLPLLTIDTTGLTPPVRLTDVAANGVEIHGLRVVTLATTAVATTDQMRIAAPGALIEGCRFSLGAYDVLGISVVNAGTDYELYGNSLTLTANGPTAGVRDAHAGGGYSLVEANTIDGSTFYWRGGAIEDNGVASGELVVLGNTLRGGSGAISTHTSSLWHFSDNVQDANERLAM